MKQILCAISMIIASVCTIIISIIFPIIFNINSNKIMNSINNTSYIETCEKEVKIMFSNYMNENELKDIMKKINIEGDIKYIVNTINNSNKTEVYNTVSNKTNDVILSVIDEKQASKEEKNKYASTMTSLYLNEIFPIKEYTAFSELYNQYVTKAKLILIIAFLIIIIFNAYALIDIKTSKWAIISIYNAIIADALMIISFGIFEKLKISNTLILNVILDLIKNIKFTLIIIIILLLLLAIYLNYIKYSKNKTKKKLHF